MSHRSAELFLQAQEFLAGGVSRNTLLRQPHPFYVESGNGCRVVDVDGIERIDFANNMASLIHGHAHPAIVEAVSAQVKRGTAFTMATEVEIDYARHLCGRSASFDKLRFVNSGTEAVMAALKAARAFTGRARIAKAEGAYHGAYDYAEVSQAPGPQNWGHADRPVSVPLAVGTPEGILRDVVVLPFNDPEAAIDALNEDRDEIACVLLDLMPHRIGLVPADDAYVQALREWTLENGALLVFDEVITFRTEVGGMQARYEASPDLTAMGKMIGGGLPVGALAGRDEVMKVFSSQGGSPPRLPHSGTFSANPLTMAAGLAAMQLFDAEAAARLNRLGEVARARIEEAIAVSGVPASVTGTGSMFRIHLRSTPPRDYRSLFPSSEEAQAMRVFIDGLYDAGVVPIHSGTGTLSTPMGEAEVDALAEAVLTSLRTVTARLPASRNSSVASRQ
ncbi:MAG: aspartate aminotransferase family protein [Acidobacteriota bacterium]|nr:aspartate aminotransferase family protein [Acidobacteriota bacterium]